MFHHLPKRFGKSLKLVHEVVTSSEAHDVHHPHSLEKRMRRRRSSMSVVTLSSGLRTVSVDGPTLTPFLVLSAEERRHKGSMTAFISTSKDVLWGNLHVPVESDSPSLSSSSSSSSVTKSSMFARKSRSN